MALHGGDSGCGSAATTAAPASLIGIGFHRLPLSRDLCATILSLRPTPMSHITHPGRGTHVHAGQVRVLPDHPFSAASSAASSDLA